MKKSFAFIVAACLSACDEAGNALNKTGHFLNETGSLVRKVGKPVECGSNQTIDALKKWFQLSDKNTGISNITFFDFHEVNQSETENIFKKKCSAILQITLSEKILHDAETSIGYSRDIDDLSQNGLASNLLKVGIETYLKEQGFDLLNQNITKRINYDIEHSHDGKEIVVKNIDVNEYSFLAIGEIMAIASQKDDKLRELNTLKEDIERRNRAAAAEQVRLLDSIIESNIETVLSEKSVEYVQENGSSLLNSAYELAMGGLKFQGAELKSSKRLDNGGYQINVKLNYLNLFDAQHYLILTFNFDSDGELLGSQYSDYSDIIAPNTLTFATVVKAFQNNQ